MKGTFLICCLCFALALLRAGPAAAAAQAESPPSIGESSNVVLVPALVYSKKRMGQPLSPSEKYCVVTDLQAFRNLSPTEPYLPKDCDTSLIRGLAAKDFHVFEHGVEQTIQSVTAESWGMTVRDNYAMHTELSLTPAGKWSTSELQGTLGLATLDALGQFSLRRIFGLDSARPLYWIAYVPLKPSAGGCPKVEVKVDRRKARVFAWNASCVAPPASDPLAGTKLGKHMENELISGKHGKIAPMLRAGSFYKGNNVSRVDIALELPRDSLGRDWYMAYGRKHWTIGVSGFVYKKDGALAARFSDLKCCSFFSPIFGPAQSKGYGWPDPVGPRGDSLLPARYETQIELPPGEYDLKVDLDDEVQVGRAQVPLVIDKYDEKELALSSVMLCKRYRDAHVAAAEAAAANFAPQYVPLVTKDIEVTPTGDTRFKKGEPLIPYFEIYEPLLIGAPATTVQAHIRVVDPKTGQVRDDYALDARPYERPSSWVIPIARQVSVDKMPKGAYRLEVQATDSAGRSTVVRTANFSVE